MPTPVVRFVIFIGVVVATSILFGLATPLALADPPDPGNTTETDENPDSGNVDPPDPSVSPAPTATPTPTVRRPIDRLRDFLSNPRSIFGNGRLPGEPAGTPPGAETKAGSDGPRTTGGQAEITTREPPTSTESEKDPAPSAGPVWTGSTAEVELPFATTFSVPVPTLPGTGRLTWSVNLSTPSNTYKTVEQTLATFNSLISDAYAPYNPFPKPTPEPQLRTFEEAPPEEPVLDVDGSGGGGGVVDPIAAGVDPPVVQLPGVPGGLPMGFSGVAPGGAPAGQPGAASMAVPPLTPFTRPVGETPAGAQPPGARNVPQSTSTGPAEAVPGTPPLRQGYSQYLRTARLGELALLALPGLAGLLTLTLSGGVIGYRQANSGRFLRQDAVRFLQ